MPARGAAALIHTSRFCPSKKTATSLKTTVQEFWRAPCSNGFGLARGLGELGDGHEYPYPWINYLYSAILYSDKRQCFGLQAMGVDGRQLALNIVLYYDLVVVSLPSWGLPSTNMHPLIRTYSISSVRIVSSSLSFGFLFRSCHMHTTLSLITFAPL